MALLVDEGIKVTEMLSVAQHHTFSEWFKPGVPKLIPILNSPLSLLPIGGVSLGEGLNSLINRIAFSPHLVWLNSQQRFPQER